MTPEDFYVMVENDRVTLKCPLGRCGWDAYWDLYPSLWTLNRFAKAHLIEEHVA